MWASHLNEKVTLFLGNATNDLCQTIVLEHFQANCPSVKKEMQTLCILFVKKHEFWIGKSSFVQENMWKYQPKTSGWVEVW